MAIKNSGPLPVSSATASANNDAINYKLKKPFKTPLFLGVIDVTLNSAAAAPYLAGTVVPGTATKGATLRVQANQAKFTELLNHLTPATLTVKWESTTMAVVDIISGAGAVAVSGAIA